MTSPPIAVFRWGESGLLVHFPEHAVLGALPVLELAADADPLALIQIILLLDPVEHQTLTALTDVAEGGVDHGRIPPFHNSAALSIARREEGRKGGAYPGRDMQRRGKGLPLLVCLRAAADLKTHVEIEIEGLRVLLIDAQRGNTVPPDAPLEQLPAQTGPPARLGRGRASPAWCRRCP